ncbi:hypothetical protein CXB51_031634 [Gossypium anomalum]|uniref:hAT-like transposase RNase-H fold domain-containing protein n=1 Tax=Gossypium anomalum TaxID=47600 RepID=A0A8J6CH65_9ROSI|nr:hypothetical protein CXB51_031634 [Gossypium anomalum]
MSYNFKQDHYFYSCISSSSSMVVIKRNENFNAQNTTHERPTPEEAKRLDDIEVTTYMRINRKKASIVSLKGQGNLFLPLQAPRSDNASGIQTWNYDQGNIREVVSHMIMVHELPFTFTEYELFTLLMKTASPYHKCLQNWGLKEKLPLNGKLFHIRCCAHILNLLVHDGLSKIEDVIDNVRESVKYITASTVPLTMFNDILPNKRLILDCCTWWNATYAIDIVKQLQLPNKRLILDCYTRWNATYAMLSFVLEFKDVFLWYAQRDASYKYFSSSEDWVRVEEVCSFLALFNEDYVDEYAAANFGTSMENDVQECGVSNASTISRIGKGKVMTRRSKFERYIRSVDKVDNVKFELDIY